MFLKDSKTKGWKCSVLLKNSKSKDITETYIKKVIFYNKKIKP